MTKDKLKAGILGGLCVLTMVATGCSPAASGTGPDTKSLVFVGQGGSYQAAQTKAFIEPWVAKTGAKVSQSSPSSWPKLEAMVDAGHATWDIMEAYSFDSIARCDSHLEKIDWDIVDKSKVEEGLALPCGVPNMKSALILVYNTDKYKDNPPTGWKDFFDTEKFPGSRGVMNDPKQGGVEAALLADGVSPASLYPLDYDKAFKKLDSLGNNLQFIQTGADQEQAFANKTVDMMIAWPGRAYSAVEKGATYTPVWDQALFYNDVFVVPKGAPNKKEAMEFLAQVVEAQNQAKLAENIAYAPINPASKPEISDLKKSFMPLGQDKGTGIRRDDNWWAENVSDATTQWTKWAAS